MSDKEKEGIVEKAGKATVKALVVGAGGVAGTVAAGPVGGVVASSGLTFIVESIQEYLMERSNNFAEQVGNGLVELEHTGVLSLEDLAKDEQFITTLTNALRTAGQTHHKEKREALKNAVLNAAITRDSKIELMITLLQQITPLHIVVIKTVLFNCPVSAMKRMATQGYSKGVLLELLLQEESSSEHELKTLLPSVLASLEANGLCVADRRYAEGQLIRESISVSQFGKLFLKYIDEPEVEKGTDDQG